MSNTVDNRVVQMNFDNKQFESGVKTSIATLDTLKKGLNLSESAKGITNVTSALKGIDLSKIAEGVQNISSRFSTFGIIGMSVINNLTTSVMEFGNKLWTSLVAPAKQGFSEYETQMNAIQTIMANTASKGTTLDQVNAALAEMNTYADRTIYSFPEMAKNMGTFTAAGIDLQTAAAAIKGIANLAAVSGSNSQQAATAMYQLSQALSSGTVKLMDWNSVVNAGMGGQVFQDALKETARLHGVAIDDMITKEGSFRETLAGGWLSSQILTETLSKFTGDLKAEELKTLGYTETQITEIMKLGVLANDAATKVKTLSQLKETLQEAMQSGWAQTWQLIVGDFGEAKSFFTYLSDTFGGLIGQFSDARNVPLQGWKNFGGQTLAVEALKNVLDSAINVINIFKTAWNEIFPSNPNLAGFGLFKITLAIRNFTKNLQFGSDTAYKIKAVFRGLFAILDIGKMAIMALLEPLTKINSKGLKPFLNHLLLHVAMLGIWAVKLRDSIKANNTFGKAMEKVGEFVGKAKVVIQDFIAKAAIGFGKVANFVLTAKQAIQDFFNDVRPIFTKLGSALEPFKKAFQTAFNFKKVNLSGASALVSGVANSFKPLEGIKTFVINIFTGLVQFFEKLGPTLSKIGTSIGSFIGGISTSVGSSITGIDFNKIFAVIGTGLLTSLVLSVKKFIDKGSGVFDGISGIFTSITGILDGVRGSLEAYQKNLQSKTLLNIAIAVGLLAASLLVLSMIDSKKLMTATGAVTVMFADLTASIAVMNKTGGSSIGPGLAISLIGLGLSILIIVAALKTLSDLDNKQINSSLIALGAITSGLIIFSSQIGGRVKSFMSTALSLILIGFALQKITDVIATIGGLKPEVIQNGLIAIGATLAELTIFMRFSKADKMGATKGLGILLMSKAILLLADAVYEFGNMKVDVLKQGLLTLGAILIALGAFTKLTGNGGNLLTTGVGMAVLAGGILVLAIVIEKMGNLTWDKIGRGLATLAGALLIISLAMYAMQGSLGGAVALLIISGALAILTPILQTLGSMDISQIAIALGTLAGVFLILGVAGYALTPVVPTLFLLGVAITLLGVGLAAMGGGLLLFSMGLAGLAVSGVAGALAFAGIVRIILGLVPVIIATLINAIVQFANGIATAAPAIGAALLALLLTLCDIVIQATPALATALTTLLLAAIQVIRTVVPQAVDAILFLIGSLLSSLAEKIPEFTQSAFDILIGFLTGIRDNIGEVVTVVGEIVTAFLDAVALKLPDIIQSGFNLLISFINGITDAIENNGDALGTAVTNLATAIITGLTDGLLGGIDTIVTAIGNISSGIITALKTLLGIASPSKVTYAIGLNVSQGLANGLIKGSYRVENATERVGKKAILGMSNAIKHINDILNSNLDMNPVIRPVLDLTGIESGGRNINNIFGKRGIQLSGSMDNLSLAASRMSTKNETNEGINKSDTKGTSVTFNQNNYSPKALSQFEIYRETRNQLLMLKGLVATE